MCGDHFAAYINTYIKNYVVLLKWTQGYASISQKKKNSTI